MNKPTSSHHSWRPYRSHVNAKGVQVRVFRCACGWSRTMSKKMSAFLYNTAYFTSPTGEVVKYKGADGKAYTPACTRHIDPWLR